MSNQNDINSGPGGTFDINKLQKYITEGQFEFVNPDDYDKLPLGARICYTGINDKFRSGGFLTKVEPNYFMYKGYGNAAFSLQRSNIAQLFISTKRLKDYSK